MKIIANLLWTFFVAMTFIVGLESRAAAQSSNPCDTPNNLPSSFFEVPKGPDGPWTAYVSIDPTQDKDPQIPVVVAGTGAIQGPAGRRGMRLGCGLLKNRSQKAVVDFQLRWILVRTKDRAAVAQTGYSPDTVAQAGYTPTVRLDIPKEGERRTDFSIISFAAVTQPLLNDGILSGDYVLLVGVQHVFYDDGTIWNAGPFAIGAAASEIALESL